MSDEVDTAVKLELYRNTAERGRMRCLWVAIAFLFCASLHAAPPQTLSHAQIKELVIYAPRPDYPLTARELHETGSGIFTLTIDLKTGRVVAINVDESTGRKRLDWACIKALMRWRFKPGTAKKVHVPISFFMG